MEFAGSNYPVEEEGGKKPDQAPASSSCGAGVLRLLAQNSKNVSPCVFFFQCPTEFEGGLHPQGE